MNRILVASSLAFVVAGWAAVGGQQRTGAGVSRTDDADDPLIAAIPAQPDLLRSPATTIALKTGGLSLEGLSLDRGADAETWEKVVRKVRAGLMPPAGAKRPERAALDAFAGSHRDRDRSRRRGQPRIPAARRCTA